MGHQKICGLAVAAAMALTAFLGVDTVGASSLTKFAPSLPTGTVIEASLESGNSMVLEDVFGLTATTCSGSSLAGTLSRVTPTGQPTGNLSVLSFTPCPHTVDVLSNGQLEIRNIAGTTNATVLSYSAEVTVFYTLLNQSCLAATGAGTDIGTLTGATSVSSKATIDINGLIPLINGECGASSARWTGKYEVSKPLGLVSEA